MPRLNALHEVDNLLRKHEITKPPVPVEDIARAEGIKVVRAASKGAEAGFLLRNDAVIVIGINSRNVPKRQRLTIAHELGHWALHGGKPLIVDHLVRLNKRDNIPSQATEREEIQANTFAVNLLMPREFVLAEVNSIRCEQVDTRDELIDRLARTFYVSREAMGCCLINLGLLSS